jgi:hypothetical protein
VAIGDLNGDGSADVATANFGSTVSVLPGHGDGSLGVEISPEFGAGDSPVSLAIGDLNGDGSIDLVTANEAIPRTPTRCRFC